MIAVAHAILEITYQMLQSGEFYRELGEEFFHDATANAPKSDTCERSSGRQALYRSPKPWRAPQLRLPADLVEQAVIELAEANQTDG